MAAVDPENNMDNRSKRLLLKTLLRRPDFLLSVLIGVFVLVTLYYWLLLRVSTFETVLANMSTEPIYLAAISVLVPITLGLFGLNFGVATMLFRAGGSLKWQSGALLGALVGGFGASCPMCGAFLLSLIGVTAGLGALPFAGLELWSVSTAIMALALGGSLRVLDKNSCDWNAQATACWQLPKVDRKHLAVLLVLGVGLTANLYAMVVGNEALFIRLGRM